MNVRLDTSAPELEHVETCNVPTDAQAQLDREYIRFLELRNERLTRICQQARLMMDLAAAANSIVAEAVRLLATAEERDPLKPRNQSN